MSTSQHVTIIAEVGSNWWTEDDSDANAQYHHAKMLIRECAIARVDAVKFQYFRADTMYAPDYVTLDRSRPYDAVKRCELPTEWLEALRLECDRCEVEFMCTVYHQSHVPILHPYVKRWKLSSYDTENVPLIDAMIATGKPITASTGMLNGKSVFELWRHCWRAGGELTLLHCVSSYPAPPEAMNLTVLGGWDGVYPRYGLSDHTFGADSTAAVMAVALGATVIEKHVTINRNSKGPDHAFSIHAHDELPVYVKAIRRAELMRGHWEKRLQSCEDPWDRWNPATGLRGS